MMIILYTCCSSVTSSIAPYHTSSTIRTVQYAGLLNIAMPEAQEKRAFKSRSSRSAERDCGCQTLVLLKLILVVPAAWFNQTKQKVEREDSPQRGKGQHNRLPQRDEDSEERYEREALQSTRSSTFAPKGTEGARK